MKPLLAHTLDRPERVNWSEPVWLQPKLNGIRALSQGGNFQSRDELPWPTDMLKHIGDFMKAAFPSDWVLDGELYVHGWPLQRINQAVAVNAIKRGAIEDTPKVEFHIFDHVSYQLPFQDRFFDMFRYKGLFGPGTPVKLVNTILAGTESDADDFYAATVGSGYEGIMYRLGECLYTRPKQEGGSGRRKFLSDKNNRVWHMLKRKGWQDNEFECVRVDEGVGKRMGKAGALICKTVEGREFGVGSGLTDAEALHYLENPPIGHKVKVKYLCLTSDRIPFNPTVIAVL